MAALEDYETSQESIYGGVPFLVKFEVARTLFERTMPWIIFWKFQRPAEQLFFHTIPRDCFIKLRKRMVQGSSPNLL